VALARALAIRPRLLMFDEPLGALDRALREGLLNELRSILHETKVPALYVTHDQEEAFAIADRILILQRGDIIREGTPAEVWSDPQSTYVAEFLGLGNMFDGKVIAENKFQTDYGNFTIQCTHKHSDGGQAKLLARPFVVAGETNALHGVVQDVIFQQDRFKVTFDNGLYVYLSEAPRLGTQLNVPVKIECLA
jgi:spermidine/putrescine transport system ATP-binding protein